MTGPLDGFRVLDLSSVVLGPLATQVLGDLGAEVIKIESPEGDTTRRTGPQRSPGMAALFMGVNRNKRSAVLDLKQAAARDALWRLIDRADVFIHSIRPQKIARLGFGHESVCERNPRIVYAGLHGYRTDGPYGGQPAYDDVIQGRSGSADLMARLVGEPRYMPTIMADKTCALVAAYSVIAALLARERTGRGQFVEIPMFETMAAFNLTEHIYGRAFDPAEAEMGYPRVLVPWRRPLPDVRRLYLHARLYRRAVAALLARGRKAGADRGSALRFAQEPERQYRRGLPDRRGVPRRTDERGMGGGLRTAGNPGRAGRHARRADGGIRIWTRWGSSTASVNPSEGGVVLTDPPVRFSDAGEDSGIRRLQPRFGEHSAEVLAEAGLGEEEIAALFAAGASHDGRGDTGGNEG